MRVLIIFLIFSLIALYLSNSGTMTQFEHYNNTTHISKKTNYTVYLCYLSMCSHCKELKQYLNELNCNKINYISYNVINTSQYKKCRSIINSFNGTFLGVPTVIVYYNNKYYEIFGFLKRTSLENCGKNICFYNGQILGTIDIINYTFCGDFDLVIKNLE